MQPSYMPWLGHFDLLRRADLLILYDDAQYDKGGWRNRNRIRTSEGWAWLTVPVRTAGRFGQPVNMVEIKGNAWARRHLRMIERNYRNAPYFTGYMPVLEALLTMDWPYLVNLNAAVFRLLQKWLSIETPVMLASQLRAEGKGTERLIEMCRRTGATRYLSADAASGYLDVDAMARAGITVEWQGYEPREYPQQHSPFVSHLSALDLILNTGPKAKEYL